MILMLFDHVREYFFLHRQVTDPMDLSSTEPELFFYRWAGHICAPVFVFLSGVAAFLYRQRNGLSTAATSRYLVTRGAFLIALEVTVVNFAWTFTFPPERIYLQVIWAIGASMVLLGGLVHVHRSAVGAIGVLIVAGHDVLAPIDFSSHSFGYVPWALIHERTLVSVTDSLFVRTSYPILPWVGIMALGYAVAGIFSAQVSREARQRWMIRSGVVLVAVFVCVRALNGYGDRAHWRVEATELSTVMSFINLTKYPASPLFVALTLGIAAIILVLFDRIEPCPPRWMRWLGTFGKVPLFFYVVHLYVLHLLYVACFTWFGANQGARFGFDAVGANALMSIALLPPLFAVCQWFSNIKRRYDHPLLAYL